MYGIRDLPGSKTAGRLRIPCSAGIVLAVASLLTGCGRQRDLYQAIPPLLAVEGDWMPALGIQNMSNRATARFWCDESGHEVTEFCYKPNWIEVPVGNGTYDILLFNGLMHSDTETRLDGIRYEDTDDPLTFRATALAGEPNPRLTRADDEFLAGNGMEVLASAYATVEVDGTKTHAVKYVNGWEKEPESQSSIEQTVTLTPRAISYPTSVSVQLINPASAAEADGALRGFAASAYLASGLPAHVPATHQLTLNDLLLDDTPAGAQETGTIRSPLFITFGPPADLAPGEAWTYAFELSILLTGGTLFERTFDVTDQMDAALERIQTDRSGITRTDPLRIGIGPVELPEL